MHTRAARRQTHLGFAFSCLFFTCKASQDREDIFSPRGGQSTFGLVTWYSDAMICNQT